MAKAMPTPPDSTALGPEVYVGTPVKALVGLVQEQDVRIREQCDGEVELLACPAGQILGDRLLVERVAELGEDGVAAPDGVLAPDPRSPAEHHQVVVGGEEVEQSRD